MNLATLLENNIEAHEGEGEGPIMNEAPSSVGREAMSKIVLSIIDQKPSVSKSNQLKTNLLTTHV